MRLVFFKFMCFNSHSKNFLLTINQCSNTNTNYFDVSNNKNIYIFVLLRQIKIFEIFSFNIFMLKFRIFLLKLKCSNKDWKNFYDFFIFFSLYITSHLFSLEKIIQIG